MARSFLAVISIVELQKYRETFCSPESFASTLPRGHPPSASLLGKVNRVSIPVPLLSREQIERLPDRAREVVEYRKSGLSLAAPRGCIPGG
jgi:hypothetical protein